MKKLPFTACGGPRDILSILQVSGWVSGSRHGDAQPGPGVHQGLAGPVPPRQPGAGQPGGTRTAPTPGTSLRMGQEPAGGPSSVGPTAGQGCRELETGLAATLLRWGPTAPGGSHGVLGRDSWTHKHPWGPDRGLSYQQGLPSQLAEVWGQTQASLPVPKQDTDRGGSQVHPRSQTIR